MENMLAKLQGSPLNEFIVDVRGHAGEMTVEIKPEHNVEVLQILKKDFGFDYLADITASDYYTDQGRFEIAYNIVNLGDKVRLRICCRIEEESPELHTVIPVWGSAEWYEREAFDMMGIQFTNHPDLRRIYMPEDFEYFPLRKEFPQLGLPGSIELPPLDPPKEYK